MTTTPEREGRAVYRCIFCHVVCPGDTDPCPACGGCSIFAIRYGSLEACAIGDRVFRRSWRWSSRTRMPVMGEVVAINPDETVMVHWRNRKQPEQFAAKELTLSFRVEERES